MLIVSKYDVVQFEIEDGLVSGIGQVIDVSHKDGEITDHRAYTWDNPF